MCESLLIEIHLKNLRAGGFLLRDNALTSQAGVDVEGTLAKIYFWLLFGDIKEIFLLLRLLHGFFF